MACRMENNRDNGLRTTWNQMWVHPGRQHIRHLDTSEDEIHPELVPRTTMRTVAACATAATTSSVADSGHLVVVCHVDNRDSRLDNVNATYHSSSHQ